jgi:PD-(D/E)XK nuclease superfamily
LGDIPNVTPSAYSNLKRCPRLFLLSNLLRVPESDGRWSPDLGLMIHAMLKAIHDQGRCDDRALVSDVLTAHGVDNDVTRTMVERHVVRCPRSGDRSRHEVELARFLRRPPIMFMAHARIDAIWVHDGILDARDYKTGARHYDQVADDPAARVQAFVLAPHLARVGATRLRIRYEQLAPEIDEDPEPFEPEGDDLDAIADELIAAISDLWSGDGDLAGVNDPIVCGTCAYRSICRDTAAAGEPLWPALAFEV